MAQAHGSLGLGLLRIHQRSVARLILAGAAPVSVFTTVQAAAAIADSSALPLSARPAASLRVGHPARRVPSSKKKLFALGGTC